MTYMHRIWMGSEMPERYQYYGELWKELNPELKLWDWTEEEIMDSHWRNSLVLHKMYKESKQEGADLIAYYTHVADVVDYELIWGYGGWYFNTDLKPLKPLSILNHQADRPGLAMEDDFHPVNMAMYGPLQNHFFNRVIEMLPTRYFGMPGAFMNATTGVQLLEAAKHAFEGSVTLWNRKVFNPIHFTDFGYGEVPNVEREFPEETVAVHEWGHRTNQRGQRILES